VLGDGALAFFEVVADMGDQQMTIPRIVDHIVLTEDGTASSRCGPSPTTTRWSPSRPDASAGARVWD
jgi:hypothetical protein